MMMRYAILIALLLCLPVRGEAWQVVGGGTAATSQTFIVNENFDGTGTPGGAGLTWAGASPNYDYATSPAPLDGTQSLYLAYGDKSFTTSFSGQSSIYVAFRMRVEATYTTAVTVFYMSDGTKNAELLFGANNTVLLRVNGVNGTYSDYNYYIPSQTIFVKLYFDTSTDTITYWYSTDGTTWINQWSYNGDGLGDIIRVGASSGYNQSLIFDTLKVSTTDINF